LCSADEPVCTSSAPSFQAVFSNIAFFRGMRRRANTSIPGCQAGTGS
jgi:hypothetical protein